MSDTNLLLLPLALVAGLAVGWLSHGRVTAEPTTVLSPPCETAAQLEAIRPLRVDVALLEAETAAGGW